MKIEFKSVIHRYSNIPGVVPTPAELIPGELALNLADGKLFTIGPSGMVIDLTAINSKFNFAGAVTGDVLTYDALTGKYAPQAPAATGTETLWTNSNTTTIAVGGIASGTSGANLIGQNAIQLIEKMLYPYVAPTFSSLSVSGISNPFEIGQSFPTTALSTSWSVGSANSSNWIAGTGAVLFKAPGGSSFTQVDSGFNIVNGSPRSVTFTPSFTAPTSPTTNNTITIRLQGQHNVDSPTTLTLDITRNWRSKIYVGKSSNSNLQTPVFDIAGTDNDTLLDTSSAQGPSNKSVTVGAGAGYFYLFIHNSYTLNNTAPYYGLKYGGNALAQDAITTVSLTNSYNNTSSYKRYKSTNMINDEITIIINPTS